MFYFCLRYVVHLNSILLYMMMMILLLLGDRATDKATKAITNSEIVSISKKITMLEMKELNERQRAEHCQRMYEHLRNTLKQAEERNFELETKFAEVVIKLYLHRLHKVFDTIIHCDCICNYPSLN